GRGDGPQRRLPRRVRPTGGITSGGGRAEGAVRRRRCHLRAHGAVAALQLRRRGERGMSSPSPALQQQVTLVELVDRVLNKGVALTGDITLSVAGVDLVYVGLRVLLASVSTLEQLDAEETAMLPMYALVRHPAALPDIGGIDEAPL